MAEFERIGVVGAGLMGAGIAEVSARAGLDVAVREINDDALAAGRARIGKSLDRGVRAEKLSAADRDAALARISFTTDLGSFDDRDLVIEAVAENESIKNEVFRTLDEVLPTEAVIASNTSSLPIARLAAACGRPDRVLGVHFFNPVPVMKLVELIPSLLTAESTVERLERFVGETLGKQSIRAKDNAGFVVNALLIPYLLGAVRMLESGRATVEDIDTGMVLGCSHPMGPLRLADYVGLDTTKAVADSMYAEYKEPLYAAPPLLMRMVDAGLYGRKSGRGFYDDYS